MGKVLDIIRGESLRPIREEVEQFTNELMREYLEECQKTCNTRVLSKLNTKNFYDSVWGTIEITEGEILILDSPILQRLRNIKQLGLADLLYSSANHSRFSHSLGVIYTADVIQRQLEKELDKKGQKKDPSINQLVRLAAMFHDCGHMFCSHASERFFQKNISYSQYDKIEKIRNAFKKQIAIKPSLSEIISVCIVQSSSVEHLLSMVEPGLEKLDFNNGKKNEVIEKICCFILGYPYSEKLLPYSQIISGQIDSDKLDYLKRDSHATGVPAAVDMSRVFQKLRVVEAKKDFSMKSTADEDMDTRYTIAIAPAAINTVDQLIVSRYMMFENVYFHQKTLTAEELLRHALYKLDRATTGLMDNFNSILKLTDADIVHSDFATNIKNCNEKFDITNEQEYKEACGILSNLYKRKLFKRSVAFTKENMVNIGHRGCDFYSVLFNTKDEEAQAKFVDSVKLKTIELKKLLCESKFNYNEETDILLIIAPDITNVAINSNLAIADKNNKYRDMEFEADSWLKSRSTRKPQNYLVTFPEDRYLVYIASEYVLLKEYGMLISDSIIYDEKDKKIIDELKEFLNSKDIYQDAIALMPEKEITLHNRQIEKLVNENWKYYELISENNGFATSMDITHLAMFIKQFYQFEQQLGNYELFVRNCIDLLENVKVVSRKEIFTTLQGNFQKIVELEHCAVDRLKVCNIGNVQDSGAQIAYQINNINTAFKEKLQVQCLEDALKFSEEGQVIVFIDDAFCSGKQIISIFETYMGVPKEERQTNEVHVSELSEEQKEKLKKSKLYFSFVFYNRDNEKQFLDRLKELGLTDVSLVASEEFPKGCFKGVDSEDKESTAALVKRYFEAAGKMLIEQKAYDESGNRKENWSDERMENSVLGYNNAQQLIVFAWNTPTYTLTPLWMSCQKEGKEWYPLFPRIDK